MNYQETARDIVELAGGKDNIAGHLHCATRLRLILKNKELADYDGIKQLPGIMGIVDGGDQTQIIIGTEVDKVYAEVERLVPLSGERAEVPSKPERGRAAQVMASFAGIFAPIIPAIAGAGLIKTLLTVLVQLGVMTDASETYQILYIAADSVFKFLPIVLAYNAAEAFKTNKILAVILASALFYPTLTNASAEGIEYLHVFGLPVKVVDSSSSVIPILLTTFTLKYVYDAVDKVVPPALRMFFTPFVVLLFMTIIELVAFAPLGSYLGAILMQGMSALINASKLVSGAVIGALWIPLVITGMHHGVIPLLFQEIATNGSTILMPATNMANCALAATVIAVMVRTKSANVRSIAAAAAPSAAMGITEPGIYGIMIKYKPCVIATMAGGAVGGAFVVMTGAVQYFFGGLGVFTPILNIGSPHFLKMLIATVLAFAVSFGITFVMFSDESDDLAE